MPNLPTRDELVAQHSTLRRLIADAVREARRLRAGDAGAERALALAVVILRRALTAHNASEERMLQPLLARQDRAGALRAHRMIEEHAAEHSLFENLLDRTLIVVAEHMDEMAEELDAHMLAEERTFLSPVVFEEAR